MESSILHPEWKKRLLLVFGKCSSGPSWFPFCILAGSSLCFALHDLYFIHWWECWMISVSEIFVFLSSLHSEFEGFRRARVYRERQIFAILFTRIDIWDTKGSSIKRRFRHLNQAHLHTYYYNNISIINCVLWSMEFREPSCTFVLRFYNSFIENVAYQRH